jgi:hypothetical protein
VRLEGVLLVTLGVELAAEEQASSQPGDEAASVGRRAEPGPAMSVARP